jgi:hypothetical protein
MHGPPISLAKPAKPMAMLSRGFAAAETTMLPDIVGKRTIDS